MVKKSKSNSPQHSHYIAIVAVVAVVAVVILVMNNMKTSTPVEDMAMEEGVMEEVYEVESEGALVGEPKMMPRQRASRAGATRVRTKTTPTVAPKTKKVYCPSNVQVEAFKWRAPSYFGGSDFAYKANLKSGKDEEYWYPFPPSYTSTAVAIIPTTFKDRECWNELTNDIVCKYSLETDLWPNEIIYSIGSPCYKGKPAGPDSCWCEE